MNNKDDSFVSGLALALAFVFICLIVAGVNGSEGEKCIKKYCDREREEGEIYCYLHKPYKHNYSYDYDWDRYYEDDDYAAGVDDAMDELEGDW